MQEIDCNLSYHLSWHICLRHGRFMQFRTKTLRTTSSDSAAVLKFLKR